MKGSLETSCKRTGGTDGSVSSVLCQGESLVEKAGVKAKAESQQLETRGSDDKASSGALRHTYSIPRVTLDTVQYEGRDGGQEG